MVEQKSNIERGPSFLLKQALVERIKTHGPITFASFMQECLYGKYGFFSLRKARMGEVGSERGFLNKRTAPEQTPLFGKAVAAQLRATWEKMDKPERFDVVEMGAGTGSLAKEIVGGNTKELWPDFYEALNYTIVEVSPSLIEEQRKNIANTERVNWILGSAIDLPLQNVEGVILSNELVDNFPFHRVVMEGGKLKEMCIGVKEGELTEIHNIPSTPQLEAYLRRGNICLQDGEEAWVNLNALRWMRNVGKALKRGFVITIDYGDEAKILYSSDSILRQLFTFQKNVPPINDRTQPLLAEPGNYDITAGVDFTALIKEGRKAGLAFIGLLGQKDFLTQLGLPEVLMRMANNPPSDPEEQWKTGQVIREASPLLDLTSNLWKVLIQRKGEV